MSGLPKTVVLEPEEIRGALEEPITTIIDSIVACLGEAPPDLAQDLIVNGIHLVGGGALLRGLRERLTLETEVQVKLVDLPLEVVVLGAGRCIESYDALRVMFMECSTGCRRQSPAAQAVTGGIAVPGSWGSCWGSRTSACASAASWRSTASPSRSTRARSAP